ncbi:histone deacetylase family protein [Candidatus Woesearchaeota archaeon]|nr:histone deacetylase family protein [Candidatus Woesearchaeota archaeon]
MINLLTDPIFCLHKTGNECPESPARLERLVEAVSESNILERIYEEPETSRFLTEARKIAHKFHDSGYAGSVSSICKGLKEGETAFLDNDTVVSRCSYDIAAYALGMSKRFAEQVLESRESYFLLLRPPGHHAKYNSSSGFCVFNNVALAAYTMLQKSKKVLILDIDVHHGDGTHEFVSSKFYDKTDLWVQNPKNYSFISINQEDIWPGVGDSWEDEPNVFVRNLAAGTDDKEYIDFLKQEVVPLINRLQPDAAVVSAGFDTSKYEKQGPDVNGVNFNLTGKSYRFVADMLKNIPTLYVLEGGYNPKSIETGVRAICESE